MSQAFGLELGLTPLAPPVLWVGAGTPLPTFLGLQPRPVTAGHRTSQPPWSHEPILKNKSLSVSLSFSLSIFLYLSICLSIYLSVLLVLFLWITLTNAPTKCREMCKEGDRNLRGAEASIPEEQKSRNQDVSEKLQADGLHM